MTTVVEPLKKYMTAPAPETIGIDTFREGPTGAIPSAGQTAAPTLRAGVRAAQPALRDRSRRHAQPDGRHAPRRIEDRRRQGLMGTPSSIDLQEGPDLLLPRRADDETALGHRAEDRPGPTGQEHARPARRSRSTQFGWAIRVPSPPACPRGSPFAFVAPKAVSRRSMALKEQPGSAGLRRARNYAVPGGSWASRPPNSP